MNQAHPGGAHPGQDVLADLVAGVLHPVTARQVEAHVMACPWCYQVLSDADRVRHLLSAPDPGPMPADVWARLESGIAGETSWQTRALPAESWFDGRPAPQELPVRPADRPQAAPLPPAAPQAPAASPGRSVQPPIQPPILAPIPPTTASPQDRPTVYPQGNTQGNPQLYPQAAAPASKPAAPLAPLSFDEAPTSAWRAFLEDPPEPPPAAPVQQRVGRAVRSIRSRRDVRAEDEKRTSLWMRPGVLAAAAAAAVTVIGLGGWATVSFLGAEEPDARAAMPGTGPRSTLHASGADYTALTLVDMTKSLARTGSPTPAKSLGASAGTPAVPMKAGTVSDPARLSACLRALGDGDRSPVAVDLARFQGREAAVIVLPGRAGGYDVWVVARDCRPGAEGTQAYKSIPG